MKGTVIIHSDPIKVMEMEFPIETHASALMWGMDMFRAMNKFGRVRKFLLRIIMGRYAFRELVGLRDCIEEYGYSTKYDYDLENCNYHKNKVRL